MADAEEHVRLLEVAVEELRAEISALRSQRSETMARTFRCPACGCRRIVHLRQVTEDAGGFRRPFSLSHRSNLIGSSARDPVEAFVGRECRLVEWHVLGFELTDIDGERAIEIDSRDVDVPPTPYR